MDLWQKWMGNTAPTLITLEGDRWRELPSSPAADRELDRRAAKEQWDAGTAAPGASESSGASEAVETPGASAAGEGYLFHLLVTGPRGRRPEPGIGSLEISSRGVVLATIDGEEAASGLAQMREARETVTTAQARASRRADGGWRVEVWM